MPWRFFIARVKLYLVCSAGLCSMAQHVRDVNGFQMVGLWSQNIDMPEKVSNVASHGFLCRYGIVISFTYKVASRVKSDGLKAMLWCRVVLWRNSKAGRVALVLWAMGWFGGCG